MNSSDSSFEKPFANVEPQDLDEKSQRWMDQFEDNRDDSDDESSELIFGSFAAHLKHAKKAKKKLIVFLTLAIPGMGEKALVQDLINHILPKYYPELLVGEVNTVDASLDYNIKEMKQYDRSLSEELLRDKNKDVRKTYHLMAHKFIKQACTAPQSVALLILSKNYSPKYAKQDINLIKSWVKDCFETKFFAVFQKDKSNQQLIKYDENICVNNLPLSYPFVLQCIKLVSRRDHILFPKSPGISYISKILDMLFELKNVSFEGDSLRKFGFHGALPFDFTSSIIQDKWIKYPKHSEHLTNLLRKVIKLRNGTFINRLHDAEKILDRKLQSVNFFEEFHSTINAKYITEPSFREKARKFFNDFVEDNYKYEIIKNPSAFPDNSQVFESLNPPAIEPEYKIGSWGDINRPSDEIDSVYTPSEGRISAIQPISGPSDFMNSSCDSALYLGLDNYRPLSDPSQRIACLIKRPPQTNALQVEKSSEKYERLIKLISAINKQCQGL